jgi:hypothetical protein
MRGTPVKMALWIAPWNLSFTFSTRPAHPQEVIVEVYFTFWLYQITPFSEATGHFQTLPNLISFSLIQS